MTRINVVPVEELCDQHLLAEHREIVRVPTLVLRRIARGRSIDDGPKEYVLGKGHVSFFYSRLTYLWRRYEALYKECVARGFQVQYMWMPDKFVRLYGPAWKNYTPTEEALTLNRERISERLAGMVRTPRWTPRKEGVQ